MAGKITCIACGDTGLNSRGDLCSPCRKHGRQPRRDAVLNAVKRLFAGCWKRDKIPTEEEVVAAVRWAYGPRVTYAAGYRGADGSMGMFAGPTPALLDVLGITPEADPYGRTAYIVEIVRATHREGEPTIRPVARWRGGRWQRKKR